MHIYSKTREMLFILLCIAASISSAFSITGTVTYSDGTPLYGRQIYLIRETESGGIRLAGIDYSDGSYAFENLDEGDYRIQILSWRTRAGIERAVEGDYDLYATGYPGWSVSEHLSSDMKVNFIAEAKSYYPEPEIRDSLLTSVSFQTNWNAISRWNSWSQEWEFGDNFASSHGIDWLSQPGSIVLSSTDATCSQGMTRLFRDDFDGDGALDLIGIRSNYQNRRSDEIYVLRGGEGYSGQWELVDLGSEFGCSELWRLVVDDIDQDGLTEIITCSWMPSLGVGHRVILFDREGGTGVWTSRILSEECCRLCYGDLDADGFIDLVMSTTRSNSSGQTIIDGHVLSAEDDSLTRTVYPDRILLYDNEGHTRYGAPLGTYVDIVGNERPELITYRGIWGQNTQQGIEEASGSRRLAFDGHFTPYVDTADLNQDGRLDLICGSEDYKIRYYLNTSDRPYEWGWYTILPITSNSADVCISEDFDGDGDSDIIACGQGGVCWIENVDGFGNEWEEHIVDSDCFDVESPLLIQCDSDPEMEIAGLVYYCEADAPHETRIWGRNPELRRGVLYSSLMVFEGAPENLQIDWDTEQESQGSVEFRIRTGSSPFSLGEWSEPITTPSDISCLLRDGEYFYQYMATLESIPWRAGPVLKEVRFTYQFPYTLIGHPWRGETPIYISR